MMKSKEMIEIKNTMINTRNIINKENLKKRNKNK